MLSKLTIAGFHNYSDGALWDNLFLPDGISKESFINEVLRQASEFPLLYPDLEFMKCQIGEFSKKWYRNFERWYAAYTAQYEALYNVDVKTTFNDDAKDTDNDLKHFDMKRNSETSGKSQGKSEGKNQSHDNRGKAAYDAANYANLESTSDSAFSSLSSSESNSLSTSESEYHSESNSHSWEHSQTSEEWKRGNYGTTMSQELLLAEYNAWLFNLYEHMAEIFVSEFCICIYQ